MSYKDPVKNREASRNTYRRTRQTRLAYQKGYYRMNAEERRKYARLYYRENMEKAKAAQRRYKRKLRVGCLTAYGGKCACCGEGEEAFLAVDHINGEGGGLNHRRIVTGSQTPSSEQFYRWLRDNDYPPGFRVLCHNCNMARGMRGRCPHEGG